MSWENIRSAGRILKEKRDLARLTQAIDRIGLGQREHSFLCAVIIDVYHAHPDWLMTKQGQRAYKRALSEVRGTEWWGILFPVRNIESERNLKSWRAECDRVSPYEYADDDGGAA